MSRRRFLLAVAAATTLTLSACSQAVPTKISVSQAQLEQGLLQQFPKRFPVAGLLQLEMQRPALRQSYAGRMEVRFALRYEPQDRTVRAHRVEVLSLQFDGADPAVADMVSTYGPRLASQALEAFALYHVKPEELQLADSLGLQPGAITVTPQGLDVAIVAKDAAAKP